MKQADGWLLSAFSCRQAFILEVEVSQVLPHTPFTFALPFGQRFSIPLRAGDHWFRACYL